MGIETPRRVRRLLILLLFAATVPGIAQQNCSTLPLSNSKSATEQVMVFLAEYNMDRRRPRDFGLHPGESPDRRNRNGLHIGLRARRLLP